MATFLRRVIGAAKLDPEVYEEVEADLGAMRQAMTVVLLSSMAAGLGAFGAMGLRGLLSGVVAAFLGWFLWAWITFFIGTRLLPGAETNADWGQLLRTTGFATAPGILGVLGLARPLTGFIFVFLTVWVLIAFVVAVRQALDYKSTIRAFAVCLAGWVIYAGMIVVLTWPHV